MLKTIISLMLFSAMSLNGKTIDVISFFTISDMQIDSTLLSEAGYDVRGHILEPYEQMLRSDHPPKPDQIQVWNYVLSKSSDVFKGNREKRVYFLWEPWEPDMSYYSLFSRVYTWNDDLVDDKRFFKIYYPSLMPMESYIPEFEDKKLCTMVVGNWTPPRVKVVEFFEDKPEGEFEFYGRYQFGSRNYMGAIPGFHSGKEKIHVIENYRFCICYENSTHLRGYITEKIFCCFAAGCVPVYWGAPNVENYIPKNCYVDLRDFEDLDALYRYLKAMPKETYEVYLENIRTFLTSAEAQLFSPAFFNEVLLDALAH